ncbi:MAG: mechanosensitive ion channel family protein [Bacteroidetes bacterium]|nr:mechanosensitive ion channel family protein [Bacteroidota bacterium]
MLPSIAYGQPHPPAPVVPWEDTLFMLRQPYGELSPQQRAQLTIQGLQTLALRKEVSADSLVQAYDSLHHKWIIRWHGISLVTVQAADTLGTGLPPRELAERWRKHMLTEVMTVRAAEDQTRLWTDLGLAALVLGVLVLCVWLLNYQMRRFDRYLQQGAHPRLKDVYYKGYLVMGVRSLRKLLSKALQLIRLACILVLSYGALLLIFSLFPWTKPYADHLIRFALAPVKKVALAFWDYLPNLLTIAVIVFCVRLLLRALRRLSLQIASGRLRLPDFHPEWAKPTYQIIRILAYALMFVLVFPYLPGSDSAVLQGVSVFLGVLFSLGSSSAISNAVAGMIITYMRPFTVGDRVRLGNTDGIVVEKTLLVTRLRTIKNEEITLPNSTVLSNHTVNHSKLSREDGLILHTSVTIGYDVPWRTVHELLIQAALRTPGILPSPHPFILQTALNDWYAAYEINAYTRDAENQEFTYSHLHEHIQDCFREAGIEITSFSYVSLRDMNGIPLFPPSSMPASQKPPDAPAR